MAMRQPASEFRRFDAPLENPFLSRIQPANDEVTAPDAAEDPARRAVETVYRQMAQILNEEGYVEVMPRRFIEIFRGMRPDVADRVHVVRREDPLVLFHALVKGDPLVFRLDPKKIEQIQSTYRDRAKKIAEEIEDIDHNVGRFEGAGVRLLHERDRLEAMRRSQADFAEHPMYANAALWDYTQTRGLFNAFVEGFSNYRGIATVVGFVPGPDTDVGRSPFISRKLAQIGRDQNCCITGSVPTEDLSFIAVFGRVDRFSEAMLTDEELEALEERPKEALRVRYFIRRPKE
jgi:hypothetical protein